MKKINSRGMSQANKHVLMSSLSYNLKKYLRFIVKKTNVITQVLTLEQGKLTVFTKQPFTTSKDLITKMLFF